MFLIFHCGYLYSGWSLSSRGYVSRPVVDSWSCVWCTPSSQSLTVMPLSTSINLLSVWYLFMSVPLCLGTSHKSKILWSRTTDLIIKVVQKQLMSRWCIQPGYSGARDKLTFQYRWSRVVWDFITLVRVYNVNLTKCLLSSFLFSTFELFTWPCSTSRATSPSSWGRAAGQLTFFPQTIQCKRNILDSPVICWEL